MFGGNFRKTLGITKDMGICIQSLHGAGNHNTMTNNNNKHEPCLAKTEQ